MTDLRSIDLNADLGENDDKDAMARDVAIMAEITSCNIACGGHAGNVNTMRAMLHAAKAAGVAAGAHPSYPDREGFGRISIDIAAEALHASLVKQMRMLASLARDEGIALTHAKPHGALYNDAADDAALARLVAEAVAEALPGTALVGLAGGVMERAAADAGLKFIGEGFADRRYTPAARLQPRGEPGAVVAGQDARVEQALELACGGVVIDSEGGALNLSADTICLHSDSDGALESARMLRVALERAGIAIAAPA